MADMEHHLAPMREAHAHYLLRHRAAAEELDRLLGRRDRLIYISGALLMLPFVRLDSLAQTGWEVRSTGFVALLAVLYAIWHLLRKERPEDVPIQDLLAYDRESRERLQPRGTDPETNAARNVRNLLGVQMKRLEAKIRFLRKRSQTVKDQVYRAQGGLVVAAVFGALSLLVETLSS